MTTIKGMNVEVFRSRRLGDCSCGGATSRHDTMLLVDGDLFPIFEAKEGEEVLTVEHRSFAGPIAVPATVVRAANGGLALAKEPGWHMAGGNFVSTSDSRFHDAYGDAMPVHDRIEGRTGGDVTTGRLERGWAPHLLSALNDAELHQLTWVETHDSATLGQYVEDLLKTVARLRVDKQNFAEHARELETVIQGAAETSPLAARFAKRKGW